MTDSKSNVKKGAQLTQHEEELKIKVFAFIRELKSQNVIKSVRLTLGQDLVDQLNKDRKLSRPYTIESLRAFDQTKPKGVSAHRCAAFRNAFPYLPIRSHPEVRLIFESYFGRDLFDQNSLDTPLFRTPSNTELNETSPLLGDYLMFRVEKHNDGTRIRGKRKYKISVSATFYRFYLHDDTQMLRFMGLPIDIAKRFLAMRGWVNNQKRTYLCVGQIVDRSGETRDQEKLHGGVSTLAIRKSYPSCHTILQDDDNAVPRLAAAPVIHFRATENFEISASKGYLVRCTGLEHLGGGDDDTPEERHVKVRELQIILAKIQDSRIPINQARQLLSGVTGLPATHFYNKSNRNTPYGSGYLNNRIPGETKVKIDDMGPLEFGFNPLDTGSHTPTKNIAIDMTRALKEIDS